MLFQDISNLSEDAAGLTEMTTAVGYMAVCSIALASLLTLFIIFPLKERVTNAKQVQIMAGVNPVIFWISNFVWDFLIYMGITLPLAIMMYLLDGKQTLHSNNGFGTLVLLFMLLGLAGIPWAYILSFLFISSNSASAFMAISMLVTGVVGPIITYFLRMVGGLYMESDTVRFILTWLGPFFPFGRSLLGFVSMQEKNTKCANQIQLEQLEATCKLFKDTPDKYFNPSDNNWLMESYLKTATCCDQQWGVSAENAICGTANNNISVPVPCREAESYWTYDLLYGINIDVIILIIDAVLFWLILGMIESNLLGRGWTKLKESYHGSSVEQPVSIDDDVQREKDSVDKYQAGVNTPFTCQNIINNCPISSNLLF